MDDERSQQSSHMELTQEGIIGIGPADEPAGCKKVHRIPNTVIFQQAEERGRNHHGGASREATFYAGSDVECFNRKNLATRCRYRQALHQCARAEDLYVFCAYSHPGVVLMRKNLQEPADTAPDGEHQSEKADHTARDHERVLADRVYVFEPERGVREAGPQTPAELPRVAGQTLLDMEGDDYSRAQTVMQSKTLMRFLLNFYLGGVPLNTRQILIDLQNL